MAESEKYVVPEGMLKAACDKTLFADYEREAKHLRWSPGLVEAILLAAIRWLAENPPKPTMPQCVEMWREVDNHGDQYAQEWVRRMFLAPELDPLVMYIMRHFDDVASDPVALRNRADAAVSDYQKHVKRNTRKLETPDKLKELLYSGREEGQQAMLCTRPGCQQEAHINICGTPFCSDCAQEIMRLRLVTGFTGPVATSEWPR